MNSSWNQKFFRDNVNFFRLFPQCKSVGSTAKQTVKNAGRFWEVFPVTVDTALPARNSFSTNFSDCQTNESEAECPQKAEVTKIRVCVVRKLRRRRSNSDGLFSLSWNRDSNGHRVRMLSGKVEKRKSAVRNPAKENSCNSLAVPTQQTRIINAKYIWKTQVSVSVTSVQHNSAAVRWIYKSRSPNDCATLSNPRIQSESHLSWALPAKRVSLCITRADQLIPTCLQPVLFRASDCRKECGWRSAECSVWKTKELFLAISLPFAFVQPAKLAHSTHKLRMQTAKLLLPLRTALSAILSPFFSFRAKCAISWP